jgi:hypothetical protein
MLAAITTRFRGPDTVIVGAGLVVQVMVLTAWRSTFDPGPVLRNYRSIMRLNVVNAAALGAYLLARLALPS